MTDSALPALDARALRFPGLVGVFLGLSLCMHLAALVYLGFGDSMPAATAFLCGQFLLGISIIRLLDGSWVMQDIRLFFLVFFFLYGGSLPLIVLGGIGGEEAGLAGAAAMYATGMLGFNLVQWWYKQPWHDIPPSSFNRIRPSFANAILVFLGFGWVVYYAMSRGVEFSLTIDRGQVRFLGTQLWVVTQFAVNGLVMYMLAGWPKLTRNARVILVVSVIAYIVLQILLGNRRDFLPMLFFLAGVVATRRHLVVGLGTIVLGAVAFLLLTVLGALRLVMANPMLIAARPVQLLVQSNEFVSPIQTLMYYVSHEFQLRLGWTYFSAPSLFFPRVLWPEKPESLSLQFMRDAFGSVEMMGYAYTPVTEAFLNFGWVGPFLVFSLVSLGMVKLVKNADGLVGLYFICFALVLDFNRGDAGGTLYQLIVTGATFWAMTIVSRLRWAPKPWRATWDPPLEAAPEGATTGGR